MGVVEGTIGIRSNKRFSGLISLQAVSGKLHERFGDHLPVDHTSLLVQITDALGDLDNDMSRKSLRKVCELDNLVEELAAFHHWVMISIDSIRRSGSHSHSRTRK
jgi:hypothetical protein